MARTEGRSAAIIQVAQASETLEEFQEQTLSLLRELIGFEAGLLHLPSSLSSSSPPASLGLGSLPFLDRNRLALYERELAPVWTAAARGNGVAVDTEVLGVEAVRARVYYRELVAANGGEHTLWALCRLRGRLVGKVMLGRSRSTFDQHEQQFLSHLLPVMAICAASFHPQPVPDMRGFDATEPSSDASFGLSPRETEVLTYLQLGYTNAEIAHACGTSPHTVRNQLSRIFKKIGASTRAEAVGLTLRPSGGEGLVQRAPHGT